MFGIEGTVYIYTVNCLINEQLGLVQIWSLLDIETKNHHQSLSSLFTLRVRDVKFHQVDGGSKFGLMKHLFRVKLEVTRY